MNITDIKIKEVDWGKTEAVFTCVVDGWLLMTGLKIIGGAYGLFVGFPSQKGKDDKYRDICFPISKDHRREFTEKILAAYDPVDSVKNTAKNLANSKKMDDDDLPF